MKGGRKDRGNGKVEKKMYGSVRILETERRGTKSHFLGNSFGRGFGPVIRQTTE